MTVAVGTPGWQYRDWRGPGSRRHWRSSPATCAWRWRTADWGYRRFHEGAGRGPCCGGTALRSRARALADLYGPDAEVFAFCNNDPRGCAVRDARWFAQERTRTGLSPKRVPAAADITLVPAEPAAGS